MFWNLNMKLIFYWVSFGGAIILGFGFLYTFEFVPGMTLSK